MFSFGFLKSKSCTSHLNAEFNLDRGLGFDLRSSNLAGLNSFKYYVGLYIGEGRNASDHIAGNRGILGSSVTSRDGASVVNSNHISTDIMIKYLRASLQREWHWREFQKTTEGRNGFGGFIQLGYFIDKHYFKLQFDVFHLYEPHKFAYGTTRFRAQLQASF